MLPEDFGVPQRWLSAMLEAQPLISQPLGERAEQGGLEGGRRHMQVLPVNLHPNLGLGAAAILSQTVCLTPHLLKRTPMRAHTPSHSH